MKNTFCIALLTVLSLQAADHPLAPAPFAPLALAVASSLPVTAATLAGSSNGHEAFFFEESERPLTHADDNVDKALKQLKDLQLFWQANQAEVVEQCKQPALTDVYTQKHIERLREEGKSQAKIDAAKQKIRTICPLKDESISSYIERMSTHAPRFPEVTLKTSNCMEGDFWDLPWGIQRYILAMNIETGLLASNDALPVSKLTPLEHALGHPDLEMIEFMLNRGAHISGMKSSSSFDFIKTLVRSSDEKSLTLLSRFDLRNVFPPDPNDPGHPTFHLANRGHRARREAVRNLFVELAASAKDQSAESVREKFFFIYSAIANLDFVLFIRPCLQCVGAQEYKEKKATAGEQAFIDAKKWACKDAHSLCTIL